MLKNKGKVASLLAAAVLLTICAGCANEIGNSEVAAAQIADLHSADQALTAFHIAMGDLNQVLDEMALEGSESEAMELGIDAIAADKPAIADTLMPQASGTVVYGNARAEIDASNLADGYVMIRYLGTGNARLKVLIDGPSDVQYNYNLATSGEYEVFPMSDGNGRYKIGIYQNVQGYTYTTLYTRSLDVSLKDEFAPYLLPNQYVNYNSDTLAVKEAAILTADQTDTLQKIRKVYEYVISSYSYDTHLAKTVQSGYLPDLDQIFNKKKGICFDYAALITAMLRSLEIPTKLVVGYAGTSYHAWINTYSEETGWMNSVIWFDGNQWKLMDPTFASSGRSSPAIMAYIGNGSNYRSIYQY